MKKFLIVISMFFLVFTAGCSITFDFDGAMIERFTNKISYLYANCWSDMESLQENMTPENMQSMDQTCVASIKAMTKIKNKIQKLKGKIGENEIINKILDKIDEIINTLQKTKDDISYYYENGIKTDIPNLLDKVNGDKLIESLENLVDDYNSADSQDN